MNVAEQEDVREKLSALLKKHCENVDYYAVCIFAEKGGEEELRSFKIAADSFDGDPRFGTYKIIVSTLATHVQKMLGDFAITGVKPLLPVEPKE